MLDGEGKLSRKGALVQVVALRAQATYAHCKNVSALQNPWGKRRWLPDTGNNSTVWLAKGEQHGDVAVT